MKDVATFYDMFTWGWDSYNVMSTSTVDKYEYRTDSIVLSNAWKKHDIYIILKVSMSLYNIIILLFNIIWHLQSTQWISDICDKLG